MAILNPSRNTTNAVSAVGNFTAVLTSVLLPIDVNGTANDGSTEVGISLKGFKLDDTFVNTAQLMDNSKKVPLVDGGTVTITNAIRAGTLTINALRVSSNMFDGDLPLIATYLQGLADNVGSTLKLTWGFNSNVESITFTQVTVVSCPPIIIAGNDLPVYPVVLAYGDFIRS